MINFDVNSKTSPSHVAMLVPSVRKAAIFLSRFNFHIGPEEIWDGEGTKEIYIEREKGNSLLLMEPIRPGAYQRALEKRGPGLHHLAIDVLNLESFIESLSGSGWFLHTKSMKTIKQSQTAYLARPGFPGLIEVQEKEEFNKSPIFVNNILLKTTLSITKLTSAIGLESLIQTTSEKETFVLGDQKIFFKDLF